MKSLFQESFSQKILGFVVGGSFLLALAPIVLAVEVRNFTASISPTTANVSQTQSYTVTITNSLSSSKKIKGAKITIPSGFTGVGGISVGGTAAGWTITSSSTEIYVKKVPATNDVDAGELFTVGFSATAPGVAGTYTWTTRASEKENFDDVNKEFTIVSAQPTVIVTSPTATLTVTKIVTNDNGGTKVVSNFPLFIDGFSVTSGIASTTSAGPHTVSETNQTGYSATIGGDCAANGTITLAGGDNKSCTITNDDQPGHLMIVKHTIGSDGSFNFTVNGPSASTPSITTSSLSGTSSVLTVNTGTTYSVAEAGQTGWNLTSASCNDESSSLSGNTIANISIPLNENVTCTLTNTKRGSITVRKDVVNPDDGEVSDNHEFDVTLNGNDHNDDKKTISENSSKTYDNLIPGTYTIAEIGDPDFDLLRISGDDDDDASNGAPVVVTAGNDTPVTITNKQHKGTLTIVKQVVNSHGIGTKHASDFSFQINNEGAVSFTEDIENPLEGQNVLSVNPGSYNVTESFVDGYAESRNNCNVNIPSGGSEICTITNTDLPEGQGAIIVTKSLPNDNGGTATVSDFPLWLTNAENEEDIISVASDQATFLDDGTTYAVSETNPQHIDGYTENISCLDNGSPMDGNEIAVEEGHVYRCTITNDDQPGTLHIIKTIIDDNGGTAVASDFSFSVNNNDSVAFEEDGQNDLTVDAGSYSVEESTANGYTTTYENCSDIAIVNGGEATCTITNNDRGSEIHGMKFEDTNGNGIKDNGESGLAGWTISLFNGTATTTAVTMEDDLDTEDVDETGMYWFIDLPVGTYTVSEVSQNGWAQTTKDPAAIEIQSGTVVENVDFGNFALVTITGFKWDDKNGDGVWQKSCEENNEGCVAEPGLQDVTVALGRVSGESRQENGHETIPIEIIAMSLTSADGSFVLRDVGPGHHKLFEESKDGWRATNPAPRVDSFFDIEYRIDLQPKQRPLVQDSFFDVFAELSGQNVNQSEATRTIVTTTPSVPLEFGNHKLLIISEETTADIKQTSIVITWKTDFPGTSRVVYDTISHPVLGSAPNYGYANSTATLDENPKVTNHSVPISGLIAGTTYFYRTISAASPESVGDEETFNTSGGGGNDNNNNSGNDSNGPVAGLSFGFGGENSGSVLGTETTKEEQITALKVQIEELKKRLKELLREKVDGLKKQLVGAIRQRIADLQDKIRQLQAAH